jgi:hypothetical protein
MTLLLLALPACTNSGLGRTDDIGDSGTAATGDCPWTGTRQLAEVRCGSFPFAGWFVDHDAATLVATHAPGGGCAVEIEVTASGCARTERWTFAVPDDGESAATDAGVSSCVPDACSFSVDEGACAEGGGLGDVTVPVEEDGDVLTFRALVLADTAPGCSLDVQTDWN